MRKNRFLILLILLAFLPGIVVATHPAAAQTSDADKLIEYVNAYRLSKGKTALTANASLMASAQAQADYLAKTYDVEKDKDVDGTVGENGTLPFQRAYQYGYADWDTYEVVENWIALNKDYPLEKVVNNDWWRDSFHQKNLLDGNGKTYTDIGVGIAYQYNITFYIVDIGAREDVSDRVVITNEAGEAFYFYPVETYAPQENGSIIHTVREGENLQIIAQSYGISMSTLLDFNGISSSAMAIYPGDTLVIQKPYGDTSTGQAFFTPTFTDTPTATIAATFTPRVYPSFTPRPTDAPPTVTPTPTPEPSVFSEISAGGIGLIAVGIGIIGLLVFLVIYLRSHR
jgi:uncharacterized protein YkwD/LysM repeat protein